MGGLRIFEFMNTKTTTLLSDMVWGAFVADAASLGLHWIYAQPRIRRAGGEEPEFTEPHSDNYDGVPSYFAHAGKHAGDLSMYGDAALVMIRSIDDHGSIDAGHFARAFREHFGFGGEYVGYIDGPTRETLVNQIKSEEELLETAMALPYDGSDGKKKSIVSKVLSNAQLLRGQALRDAVIESVVLTKGGDAETTLAGEVINLFELNRRHPGSQSDEQLPAISRVAVLLAADPDLSSTSEIFDETIRTTHNNDRALDWTRFTFDLMKRLLDTPGDPSALESAIREISADAPVFIRDEIESIFKQRAADNKVYTMKHGPACELKAGIPAVLHNLLGARSFTDAVRRNILASGDSCGRSMVLGPIAAIMYSGNSSARMPSEWTRRLTRYEELSRRIASVTG